MSVLIETSLGDLVVDLLVDQAPKACENFLKLCKIKYYNYAPVFNLQKGSVFQTGDPLGPDSTESDGGSSIWGILNGASKKEFVVGINPKLKHNERGTMSMATAPSSRDPDQRMAASQFLITLADHVEHLDGRAAIFGKVVEGFDVLDEINSAYVDKSGRPLRDIRIRHTVILDDPYPDPPDLRMPSESPVPTKAQLATVRIADDEQIDDEMDEEALEELRRQREAKAQALTLEMVGDLPFAEVKPPENVLFVCKLNPVTQDEDLELIFSRFGRILSCEVIRDKKTGDSLQYAFVEFEEKRECEQAYFKMQDVLIDDHRIHVDFSQSVSRLSDTWRTATNSRRRKQANFGGIAGLEKRRQYRNDLDRESYRYGMVFDNDDLRARKDGAEQTRQGGFPRSREWDRRTNQHRRERSRSPRRSHRDDSPRQGYKDDSRERDYHQNPSRDTSKRESHQRR